MCLASLRIVPRIRVLLTRSDPARSTECILERLVTSCPTYPYTPAPHDAQGWRFGRQHGRETVML